jgi:hypothetical protein
MRQTLSSSVSSMLSSTIDPSFFQAMNLQSDCQSLLEITKSRIITQLVVTCYFSLFKPFRIGKEHTRRGTPQVLRFDKDWF